MSRRRLRSALGALALLVAAASPLPLSASAGAVAVPTVDATTSTSWASARIGATSRDHRHGRRLVNQRLSGRPTVRVRGTVTAYVVDGHTSSTTGYFLRSRTGRTFTLEVPQGWTLHSGSRVVSQLVDLPGARFAVARLTILGDPSIRPEALATPRAHKTYIAMATNTGTVPTDAAAQSMVAGVRAHWAGDVPAAISSFTDNSSVTRYSSTVLNPANCDLNGVDGLLHSAWSEAAGKFPGVSFSSGGNHLVLLVSALCGDASSGVLGIGSVGANAGTGGYTIAYAVPGAAGPLAHEIGHNLGLQHAGTLCPDAGDSCFSEEYGDSYSVMGWGAETDHIPALPSASRVIDNLVGAGEVTPVDGATTTTTALTGRGESSGVRGLDVTDPADGRHYYVDFRSGSAGDSDAQYAAGAGYDDWSTGILFDRGVTITTVDSQGHTGLRPHAVSDTFHGAFGTGESFTTDSGLVRITVQSLGDTATVRVEPTGLLTWKNAPNPTVSGTARVGSTLTMSAGSWNPTPTTLSYRWLVDGEDSGVHGTSFVLDASTEGATITAEVTAARAGYPTTTRSTAVGPVAGLPKPSFASTPTLSIVGSPVVGSTLTAKLTGSWSPTPDSIDFAWGEEGQPGVFGTVSTDNQLVLGPEYLGHRIILTVTASKDGYQDHIRSVGPVGPVTAALPELAGPTPTISGTPKVGRRLTVKPGTWPSGTTLRRQWYADGAPLGGRTGSRLRLTKALRGRMITVSVTGTKSGFAPTTRVSASKGPVR